MKTTRGESCDDDAEEGDPPETSRRQIPRARSGDPPRTAAPAVHDLPEGETLALPPGALLAMRKSGGLAFRSREIVVYSDGRVESSAVGGGRSVTAGESRTITAAQLAALRRAVGQIDLGRPFAPPGHAPDAFVYEIAMLVGGTPRAIVVADGRIPIAVESLIRQLNRLVADR